MPSRPRCPKPTTARLHRRSVEPSTHAVSAQFRVADLGTDLVIDTASATCTPNNALWGALGDRVRVITDFCPMSTSPCSARCPHCGYGAGVCLRRGADRARSANVHCLSCGKQAAESSWYSNTSTARRAVGHSRPKLEYWTPEYCPSCNAPSTTLALERDRQTPFRWHCVACNHWWAAIPQLPAPPDN
jgi:hypothetical protein